MIKVQNVEKSYELAREVYAEYGVDTDAVLKEMAGTTLSLHCWQGDDVTGFEAGKEGLSDGGILATGNYPGKASNGEELRADLELALSLIPGRHRVNLHAIYAETGGKFVDRNQLAPEHFQAWIDWAAEHQLGLDFNPTFFSHPLAASGFTLASKDNQTRQFWIEHAKRSRAIAAEIGRQLDSPCVNNLWVPDGSKDLPTGRLDHRQLLKDSLDQIYEQYYDPAHLRDAVESKLFGIGSEAYVVGSHDFYLAYVMNKDLLLCLDLGHFHPTENIADKISALLPFKERLLLHVSRGVRWDSDHVVIFSDEVLALMQEIKRCQAFNRVSLALDFFDASINRITAWVTGARATLKAALFARLEPTTHLLAAEAKGDFGERLALMEEFKTLPFAAVWNKYCQEQNVPVGAAWLAQVKEYEEKILLHRKY
ncbi:MAG TPA: L-rhamnose isomerase [Firmicutes bacterium]|nr:L-rhamnose isomerase [Bacillota bacterium]